MNLADELAGQTPRITAKRRKVRKLHLAAAAREAHRDKKSAARLARAQAKVDVARAAESASQARLARVMAEYAAVQERIREDEERANPFRVWGRRE